MKFPRFPRGAWRLAGCAFIGTAPTWSQSVNLTTIGLTDLRNRYAPADRNASTITAWQTEAPFNPPTNTQFLPNPAGLGTHTFVNFNPPNPLVYSGHASTVGSHFYGPSGVTPSLPTIWAMDADTFLGAGGLNFVSSALPAIPNVPNGSGGFLQKPQVMNASWVAEFPNFSPYSSAQLNADANRRADYLVQNENLVIVAGIDNAPVVPQALLGQAYNTIAVGLSNGSAGQGYSNVDGNGRMVVDLVAPATVSSYAAPTVAGVAAILVHRANIDASVADAADPLVVRSLLQTGAYKLPGWRRGDVGSGDDVVHPLDPRFGAGELRANNSYDLLVAGEKAQNSVSVKEGWSLSSLAAGGVSYYYVQNNIVGGNLTVTLNWNRTSDGTISSGGSTPGLLNADALADLNLEVFQSDNSNAIGSSLARSASAVDNVEHIYLSNLGVGRFAIRVEGVPTTEFALSFQAVPEASSVWAGAGLAGLAGAAAWRRSRTGGMSGTPEA